MTIFDSTILGLLQGLTEFLPISSSGHLILLENWLQLPVSELMPFDVILHSGTLLALIIFFWATIWQMIKALPSPSQWKILLTPLFIATLPVIFAGLFLKDWIEQSTRSDQFVGFALIFTALLLIFSEFKSQNNTKKSFENMSWKHSLMIGCFQAIAILPGISRSGATLSGGVFSGLQKLPATQFAFLLGIISIFGATLLNFPDLTTSLSTQLSPHIIFTGFTFSILSSLLTIWLFLKLVPKIPLWIFSIYLLILSGFILF